MRAVALVATMALAVAVNVSVRNDIASVCSVFCAGPVLEAIQLSGLFNDSKTFVDMPLLAPPTTVLAAFAALDSHNSTELEWFLSAYFGVVGSDLVPYTPPDYMEWPPLLTRINNPAYKAWLYSLNALWPTFTYTTPSPLNQSYHTLLSTPYPIVGKWSYDIRVGM
jgi:alpha,alpha-trehalase